jgi:hypothetical protein
MSPAGAMYRRSRGGVVRTHDDIGRRPVVRRYRAFEIAPDGGYLRTFELHAPDDEAAKVEARRLESEHTIELWFEKRFIARFEPAVR